MRLRNILLITFLWINISCGHTTQRPNRVDDDDSNSFLDMASVLIQQTMNQGSAGGGNSGGGMGGGLAGVASLIGTFIQANNGISNTGGFGGKSDSGAAQILSGIGSVVSSLNGGNGIDPSMIGNIIEMFTATSNNNNNNNDDDDDDNDDNNNVRQKRDSYNKKKHHHHQQEQDSNNIGIESVIQIASAFMQQNSIGSSGGSGINRGSSKSRKSDNNNNDNNFMSLLPMILQAVNSFSGPEGQRTQEKHKDHAWVLPPYLEQIHVMWDHFSGSDLADALWQKSGVHAIFKGFTDRDGKLDYNKLFESLHNQSFRRRWIKVATLYLADWANYLAEPEVYQKYFQTAQIMFNGFLKSQGYPKITYFDPSRPSETISGLLNHIAKNHLNVKIDTRDYVKPAVNYAKQIIKLGQSRGLLQKFNSTELSDKLTDTLNLEVIEPVLKVHRAYRFATDNSQCDKYILCELNSHDPNEKLGLAGFKSGITKFGSMAAAWFISTETGTPFWDLFGVINQPYNCETRYPYDCSGFHKGEAKVTTEYIHNEL